MYDTVFRWISDHGLSIILTIAVTIVAYVVGTRLVSRLVRGMVKGTKQRHWHKRDIEKRQNTLASLFSHLTGTVVVVVGTLKLFDILFPHVSLAPIFASAGIVGVAVGFGSQALVKDFLSGIFIVSENQYRVGDFIDISGASGTVERIGARSTVLRDAEGSVHYIPNGTIQHVINKTMGYGKARFTIAITPEADFEKVVSIINKTGEKLASEEAWKNRVSEAPHFVSVEEFTANTVNIIISGKTPPSDQWSVVAEMRRRLLLEFEKQDIALSTVMPTPPSLAKKL